MAISRKDFFKKACLAGVCFCGFTSLGLKAGAAETATNEAQPDDKKLKFMQEWISTLLLQIDENAGDEECRKIMKPCAMAHYNYLEMDKTLVPYVGDIEKFNTYISGEWGWKVDYDKTKRMITADENKSYCVCPMVNKEKRVRTSILCFCSEGFAEKMFSTVVGHPVKARVVSSIHRGNERCIYEVTL